MKSKLRGRKDLRFYQRWLAKKIVDEDEVLLTVPMSMGKTVSTLTAVRDLLDSFAVQHVLVVAPLEVANNTWGPEIESWQHTRCLSYAVATGSVEQRIAAVSEMAEITIINRENIRWLVEYWGKEWPYDMLVYDEASRLKAGRKRTAGGKPKEDPKTGEIIKPKARMSEFGALCRVRKHFSKVVELTGTPAPNGIIDLWGPIYLLDQGKRLGETKKSFEDRWFESDYMGWSKSPKPGAEEDIIGRIKDVMVSLKAEDYIELPKTVYNPVYVKLADKHMKQYRQFERDLVSEAYDVEAVTKGVLTNKLLQFCIAEDTPVLTERGWLPIQDVTNSDKVWDGNSWVACAGKVYQGVKQVVSCFNVLMTPDHRVMTVSGWHTADEVLNGKSSGRFEREDVRLPEGYRACGHDEAQVRYLADGVRLRHETCFSEPVFAQQKSRKDEVVRLQTRRKGFCWPWRNSDERDAPFHNLASNEGALSRSSFKGLSQLRWSRDRHAGRMVQLVSGFLARCSEWLSLGLDYRQAGQQRFLLAEQLSLGGHEDTAAQQTGQRACGFALGPRDFGGSCGTQRPEVHHYAQALREGGSREGTVSPREAKVYDLIDCGPSRRFVVMGSDGTPLIVHNCNGSMYRQIDEFDPSKKETIHIHDKKLDALESIVEESQGENILVALSYKFDLQRILKRFPKATYYKNDPDFVKNWNKGKIRLGLAHPASISHGLNLQFGGHIQVWYGMTWSLELYQQFNARLARPGQQNTVFIHHILAQDTVDETVYDTMNVRGATQQQVTEAVRVRVLDDGWS